MYTLLVRLLRGVEPEPDEMFIQHVTCGDNACISTREIVFGHISKHQKENVKQCDSCIYIYMYSVMQECRLEDWLDAPQVTNLCLWRFGKTLKAFGPTALSQIFFFTTIEVDQLCGV